MQMQMQMEMQMRQIWQMQMQHYAVLVSGHWNWNTKRNQSNIQNPKPINEHAQNTTANLISSQNQSATQLIIKTYLFLIVIM